MRVRLVFSLIAAACAISVLPAAAAAAAPVTFNAKPVKATASALTVKKTVFTASDRATVLLGGSVTFKSGRRTVRATTLEVTLTPSWSQLSGKLGKARYVIFSTRGPIALDQPAGTITSGALAMTLSGGARNALNKMLALKGRKQLKSARAGSLAFAIGSSEQPPAPQPPAPTPAPQPPVADIISGPEGLTTNDSPSFTFGADQTATFTCVLDSNPSAPCTSPQVYSSLADGQHTFHVFAANANGTGPAASRTFKIDTTPPTIEVDLGSGGITSSSHTVEITTSEAATLTCSLNNAPASSCSQNHEIDGLLEGDNDFFVHATDAAGNTANRMVSIHVDLNTPLCGTLTSDRTLSPSEATAFVVTCDLTVAEGAALIVEAGAVVKFAAGKKLVVDGTLEVNGEFEDEAFFTSIADDSRGGDSNGNGWNTEPQPGDWGGIVLRPGSDSDIDVFRAYLRYATNGVKVQKGASDEISVNVQQVNFGFLTGDAFNYNVSGGSPQPPTFSDNEIDSDLGGYPLVIDSPAIDQSLLGDNWDPSNKAWVISGTLVGNGDFPTTNTIATNGLTIAPDAELELDGKIVKFAPGAGLRVRGRLETIEDDDLSTQLTSTHESYGAQTPWTGPEPDKGDWRGIYSLPGDDSEIEIRSTRIRYAKTAIESVKHASDVATLELGNVDIDNASEGGIRYVAADGSGSPPPKIDDVRTDVDGIGILIDSQKIDQTKLIDIQSRATQGDLVLSGKLIGEGRLAANDTTPIADGLEIAQGATLVAGPNDVWKFEPGTALTVNGTLDAHGNVEDEPTFTSARDDRAGDSNGDDESTTPAAGDWRGIRAGSAPGVDIGMEWAHVAYAQFGVDRPASSSASSFDIEDTWFAYIGGDGVRFAATSASTPAPTIANNTFMSVAGEAIDIDSPNIDQQKLLLNTSDSPETRLKLSGTLTGTGDLRSNAPVVGDGLTVGTDATLTFMNPATWYFVGDTSLIVRGTLVVQPPAGEYVTFMAEDDGPYFNGLVVNGGTVTSNRLEIRRAYTAVSLFNMGYANLQNSYVDQVELGLDAYNGSQAVFTGSLAGPAIGARTDASSTIDAANTWWGSWDGPAPSGGGSAAVGNVAFSPHLSSP